MRPLAQPFGSTSDGQAVHLYTLTNAHGLRASISNLGATLVSLLVPDRNGSLSDIVLGCTSASGYEAHADTYLGGIIGRFAGRIAGSGFTLNGIRYNLASNNGPNTLHGGSRGFDRRVWTVRSHAPEFIELHYRSARGEEGFPGQLDVTVSYLLADSGELEIRYAAETDQDTVVNLTNHAYFNLHELGTSIEHHTLMLPAHSFLPVDSGLVPTGEQRLVPGSPFDFLQAHAIGDHIGADDQQLKIAGGYDHTWVIDEPAGNLRLCARVTEPASGRIMEVLTTQPGIHFYSGNFLDGAVRGKAGIHYGFRSGFCLETQHFPNSPNLPQFPSTVLRAGQLYREQTTFRFRVM